MMTFINSRGYSFKFDLSHRNAFRLSEIFRKFDEQVKVFAFRSYYLEFRQLVTFLHKEFEDTKGGN